MQKRNAREPVSFLPMDEPEVAINSVLTQKCPEKNWLIFVASIRLRDWKFCYLV